jgi:nicotinamide mononucleotide adenylyltransferase
MFSQVSVVLGYYREPSDFKNLTQKERDEMIEDTLRINNVYCKIYNQIKNTHFNTILAKYVGKYPANAYNNFPLGLEADISDFCEKIENKFKFNKEAEKFKAELKNDSNKEDLYRELIENLILILEEVNFDFRPIGYIFKDHVEFLLEDELYEQGPRKFITGKFLR